MDTVTGRFTSQDSYEGSVYDPVSLHKYLYANASPVSNDDPSGHITESVEKVSTAIIVIIIIAPTAGVSAAQVRHDQAVLKIGTGIIRSLSAVEDLLPYAIIWGSAIGAMISNVISGEITSLDTSEEIRDKIINDTLEKHKKMIKELIAHYTITQMKRD